MATSDNQALLLQISADLSKLEKAFKRANGIVDDGANGMVNAWKKSGKRLEDEAGKTGHNAGKNLADKFTGEAGKAIVFSRMQMMELAHVGRSVFDGLASGQNPMRLLAMEGGRLAQVMGEGSGGLGGSLAAMGALLNPVTLGFAAIATVLVGAAAATMAFDEEQRKLLVTLLGTGAASGMTVKAMNDIVDAAAKVDGASIATTRHAAEMFASIGHVSAENMPKALGMLRDYAVLSGQKVPDAMKDMAKAFADPAKGAEELNNKLYFLNEGQLETIRHMDESGDRAGALKLLLSDLSGVTDGAATHMNGLAAALEQVGKAFSDAWDHAGEFFRGMADPNMGMDYAHLQKALAPDMARMRLSLKNPLQPDKEDIQAILKGDEDRLAALKAQEDRAKTAPINLQAAQDREAARMSDPKFLKIQDDEGGVQRWKNRIAHPLIDPVTGKNAGFTTAELQELLKGAEAKLARDQHGEMRMPRAKGAPEDRSDQAVAEAQKAHDAAKAALETDILAKARAEKDAIDAGLEAQLDSLAKRKDIGAAEKAQAKTLDEQTADLKKQAIDRKAQQELVAQQASNAKALNSLGDEQLQILAGIVPTLRQRRDIEMQLLANHQAEARADLERKIAAPGYTGDAQGERNALDIRQHAETKALGVQTAGPLQQYARGIKDLDTEMQNAEVRGLQGLNDGLANLIVSGGKLGDVLHQVLQQLELDMARLVIQQATGSVLKFFGVPGFASGTPSAPAGYAMVGERGPELVKFRGGETVHTAATTSRMLSGIGGGTMSRMGAPVVVQGPVFHLQGAVVTQDLLNQMNSISQRHAAQAGVTAYKAAQRSMSGWAGQQSDERG